MVKKKKFRIPKKFRAKNGTFLPGFPGGPGRPPLPIDLENLRILAEEVPAEEWRSICKKMLKKAKKGELAAVYWLEKYLLAGRKLEDLRGQEISQKVEEAPAVNSKELTEILLKKTLQALNRKLDREGSLSDEEVKQAIEISRLLVDEKAVDKVPDLSGIPADQLEEMLFQVPAAPAVKPD